MRLAIDSPSTARVASDPGPSTGRDPGAGVEVSLNAVRLGYPARDGFVPILEDLDLHVAPGECLAVVGASGCGKSTLLHALAGLLRPQAGSVMVDGRAAGVGHAAYMFQNDLLLPWKTVSANAAFAARMAGRSANGASRVGRLGRFLPRSGPGAASGERREAAGLSADALLEEFGLGESLHLYPHQLSGGMRQRVALARTLALGRGLVLLDEPFGSLDALTRSDLQRWLLGVMGAHPATWVLVTHDVDEAVRLADRVIVLAGRPARVRTQVEVPVARGRRFAGKDDLADGVLRRAAADIWAGLEEGRRG